MFDDPIDNPTFRVYVDQVLVPTLRPGDVVVLDNFAVHNQPEIRDAVTAAPHIVGAFGDCEQLDGRSGICRVRRGSCESESLTRDRVVDRDEQIFDLVRTET